VSILYAILIAVAIALILGFLLSPDYGDVADRSTVPWEDSDAD